MKNNSNNINSNIHKANSSSSSSHRNTTRRSTPRTMVPPSVSTSLLPLPSALFDRRVTASATARSSAAATENNQGLPSTMPLPIAAMPMSMPSSSFSYRNHRHVGVVVEQQQYGTDGAATCHQRGGYTHHQARRNDLFADFPLLFDQEDNYYSPTTTARRRDRSRSVIEILDDALDIVNSMEVSRRAAKKQKNNNEATANGCGSSSLRQ